MKFNLLLRPCYLVVLMFALYTGVASAQLTVNNAVNAVDGVQTVLLGDGVTVSNITFSGANEQIGSFACTGACNINISTGLIMATGNVDQAPGNGTGNSSQGPASGFGAGDADLAELSGMTLNDAAILQFDFEATGSNVSFNFVFGSEEYPEYVNSINDAFGFFLSGPGITGPFLNNAANIALIPNTTTPVTINTVNAGMNSAYYVDNTVNAGNSSVVECDGFTTVLTAFADVQCGETYHIKLAIADASDTSWDSFVFIEGSSFSSNEVSALLSSPSYSPLGGGIYEGCQAASVTFTVPAQTIDQTFDLDYSGIALYGVDYDSLPEQITFPANQTEVTLSIEAIGDALLEGMETFTITVVGATSCGQDVEVLVTLSDLPDLAVNMPDVSINCGQQAVLTPTVSGGLGNYVVEWETGLINPTLSVFPSGPTSYEFTVSDTCGVQPFAGIANVVFIDNAPLVVNIGADLTLTCLDEIMMTGNVVGGFGPYSYSWTANGFSVGSSSSISYVDNVEQDLILTVTDECDETSSDMATVFYPPVPVNINLGPDLSVTCLDESLLLPVVSGGVGAYTYSWSSQLGNLGSASSLLYQTDQDMAIVVQVEDECGNVSEDEMNFAVPQVAMTVDIGNDLIVDCTDISAIDAVPSGGIGNYYYTWNLDGANVGFGSTYNVQVDDDATLIVIVEDECGNFATDELEVAVPPVPVTADAGLDLSVTCLDISALSALASGGVGAYSYQWEDELNVISLNANTNYQADDNQTVTLTVTDECGNTDTDQLYIDVPPVAVFADAGSDLTVTCIDISTLSGIGSGGVGNYNYQWTDAEGNIGGSSTVNYQTLGDATVTLTVTDQCGNVGTDNVMIAVPAITVFVTTSNDTTICYGESATLFASASGGVTTLVFEWENNPAYGFMQYTAYPVTSQSVALQVSDACGNTANATVWITVQDVHPSFTAEYLNDNTLAFTNQTTDAASIEWFFSDGATSTEQHPVHEFITTDEWSVTLVATAELGCSRAITQEYAPLGALFVPNCFTPDKDGINDFLFAVGHDIAKFEWWIYNRWGQELFYSTDIDMPWDGSFKSNDFFVPDGVYPYRIVAWGKRGNLIEKEGSVLIVR